MAFPMRKTIEVEKPGKPTVDRFGNKVPGTPTWVPVKVFGWGAGVTQETTNSGTSILRTIDEYQLMCAPGTVKATDRVRLPNGAIWTVEGNEKSFENNPWWNPGLVEITIRKVEG